MNRPALNGGASRKVWVRLTDVPLARRMRAADAIIDSGRNGYRGDPTLMTRSPFEALELKLAAVEPIENPGAWVSEHEARKAGAI